MSKKRTNNKENLKKIINSSKHKVDRVDVSVDIHPSANEEHQTLPEEVVVSGLAPVKSEAISEKVDRIECRSLSSEDRKKALGAIVEMWPKMKSRQDLLALLNLALQVLYGENAKKITLRSLNYYAYSSHCKNRYISFQVPKKKKGEFRTIDAPCAGLKMIQRALNLIFQTIYTPHEAAMGFVPHRSVVTNARVHVGQKYVYNIDLKDFFPSITSGRLFKRLQATPFKLDLQLASIVTDLCCYTNADGKNVLPQGAPTSPTITNFICEYLDKKLANLAESYKMTYSRYADDITFSCMKNMFAEDGNFCKSMRNIIEEEEHFKINTEKTRLCHRGERQEVTGLTVNQHVNVSHKYTKGIRLLLHYCESKGLEQAQKIFDMNYIPKTSRKGVGIPHIDNVIAGKLLYLKMVVGKDNDLYRKLNTRFEALISSPQDKGSVVTGRDDKGNVIIPMENLALNEKEILEELMALSKLLE